METIDVHSKSFVVKWIQIPDNSTVIFQLKPIKKSINFAIYKSNEQNSNSPYKLSVDNNEKKSSSSTSLHRRRSNSTLSLSLDDRLKQSSLDKVKSYGQLNGNELFKSQLKVEKGGIYAFIFDNTRSKSYSKKVLFNKFFINEKSKSLTSSSSSLSLSKQLHPAKGQFLQGYLLKKKRKKLQGFTKRFFILNFKYNTLSYYLNENSLKIRGEMQINISTISAFKDENTIVIDSGMEIWILKTLNGEDWDNWINALDFIKLSHTSPEPTDQQQPMFIDTSPPTNIDEAFNIDSPVSNTESPHISAANASPYGNIRADLDNSERDMNLINEKLSDLLLLLNEIKPTDMSKLETVKTEVGDLSAYVKSLITPETIVSSPPNSIFSQDYFDASENNVIDDHVFLLPGKQNSQFSVDELSDDDSIKITGNESAAFTKSGKDDDLYPLPITQIVKRRNDVGKCTSQPQSLFTFLRKNVGKDLSTISMPVTSNEPLTILQKIAEAFEHSNLLNEAALETDADIKMLKISTFVVSSLSAMRSKERNLRKPFNPILGETFEFVSETMGFRLCGEKINHKPQIFAFHVDSENWELSLTLNPEQKYWGKSVELINKGATTLIIKRTGEIFKWSQPSTLLKNIITGDRFSEPVSPLVVSSSIGLKSIVEFKKPTGGSLFSGPSRSEELTIEVVHGDGRKSDLVAEGRWTDTIHIKDSKGLNRKIWSSSKLLTDEQQKWGFTIFASNLNEITAIEKDHLPYTDSRYRPDVRMYELGDVKKAEQLKLEIEQRQRDERKRLADAGKVYKPNFFKRIGDLEYEFVKGEESYWNRRKTQNWKGINELW